MLTAPSWPSARLGPSSSGISHTGLMPATASPISSRSASGDVAYHHQNDSVRLVLAVKDEVPNKAVEVRNQRPAGVVEAVMSDRCLAATGEMCVAGGANGPYFNSAAQAS